MPFQKGNTLRKGVPNPNAGRKSLKSEEELVNLLDEAIPQERRLRMLDKAATEAENGSFNHFKILMAYLYGEPIAKQETTVNAGTGTFGYSIIPPSERPSDETPERTD